MEEKKEAQYTPEIGYKGLNKDMQATQGAATETFKLGSIYYKDNIENPKLCSDQGYHYCKTLKQVFDFYKNDGNNRFFKIEILGNTSHGHGKSITTAFRLVEEIDVKSVLEEEEKLERAAKEKKDIESLGNKFNLDVVRFLQTKYPPHPRWGQHWFVFTWAVARPLG